MEKCCDACGDGEYYLRSGFSASEGAGVSEASIAVDRKSMRHTLADRSSNEADFLCISCISVVVMEKCCDACGDGSTISGRVFRHHRVPVFLRHRLPLTGSRWDIRWLIGRRTKPTSVYLLYIAWRLWKSVVTLAVTGILIPVGFFGVKECPVFQRHRMPLTGSRWDIRWLIGRRTKPTFCVFPVFSVAVMESVVTLAVTGILFSVGFFAVSKVPFF
jgi:hypothetical protein